MEKSVRIQRVNTISYFRSKDTPYAKANGGNYTFVMGDKTALPNDQVIHHTLYYSFCITGRYFNG